jgi:hypothetical protein
MTTITRHLTVLIVLIAALDLVAGGVFYHLHLDQNPGTNQQIYVGVWTVVSALIAVVQLRKIRKERLAIIRAPRAPSNPVTPPEPPGSPQPPAPGEPRNPGDPPRTP